MADHMHVTRHVDRHVSVVGSVWYAGYVAGSAYQEGPAPPGLGLALVWDQAQPADGAAHLQRVVPDGRIDLIWFAHDAELQVAGPDTGPQFAEIPPGGRLVGVRFRPGLAAPALGVPADAIRDGRVPLRELWGPEADALAEQLADADDPHAALIAAVADHVRRAGPADPGIPALVAEMTGGSSIKEAAAGLGLSERQLRRRSLAAFGYGPKTLQRILRFQRALHLVRAGRSLADVAYETGYADQAHLSHEVRDLAGAPLTTLL